LDIEAVSCDEMFVDCSEILGEFSIGPMEFASHIRQEIKVTYIDKLCTQNKNDFLIYLFLNILFICFHKGKNRLPMLYGFRK
jgi:hypothetical protein